MQTGLSVDEAQRLILEETPRLPGEMLPTAAALGRVLAEEVFATRTLPPVDVSAMDGYAVRVESLTNAAPAGPVPMPVVDMVPAGRAGPRPLARGEAARVLTGAPIPAGADAVVRQEDTEREGSHVRFFAPPEKGENIRAAGEDVRAGERVLEAGTRLGPGPLGLLAALGRSVVCVSQRPRVAVVSGGDELVEPDRDVAGGRIVASNSYSLSAQCREVGAEPVYLGIAPDTPEALEARIRAGRHCDVMVSSAGVSVGDRDYVRPVLEKLGCELRFWGVRMKPGYPFLFGRFDAGGPLVFGLPGNPVSAMVTFEQFVRPALRKMMGHSAWFRHCIQAELTHGLRNKPGRLHFVRVRLSRSADKVYATSTGSQSSGVLRSMARAHGLLLVPADVTELAEGARATVQIVDEDWLAEARSGI